MNTEERINAAIKCLVRAAMEALLAKKIGVRRARAVKALGDHWWEFYQSDQRIALPSAVLAPRLSRYVAWYTRAWALLPEDVRRGCPQPDAIDPTFAGIARDTLASFSEGLRVAPEAGQYMLDQSTKLAKDIGSSLKWGIETILVALALGLVAWKMWDDN